jgi:hypothetical protein
VLNWFRRKPEEPEDERPDSPFVMFRLVDGVHLDVEMGWPEGVDIRPFANFLALLNSGSLAEAQIAAALIFASETQEDEDENVTVITTMLNTVRSSIEEKKKDRPLVLPTRVIPNHLKQNS